MSAQFAIEHDPQSYDRLHQKYSTPQVPVNKKGLAKVLQDEPNIYVDTRNRNKNFNQRPPNYYEGHNLDNHHQPIFFDYDNEQYKSQSNILPTESSASDIYDDEQQYYDENSFNLRKRSKPQLQVNRS